MKIIEICEVIMPFNSWIRFENYVFLSYGIPLSKAILCPIVFKIVQHFETTINSEFFESSDSSSKSPNTSSQVSSSFHPHFHQILCLKVFLHFLTLFGFAELTETKQKLNLNQFHFCSSSFQFHSPP